MPTLTNDAINVMDLLEANWKAAVEMEMLIDEPMAEDLRIVRLDLFD